MESIVARIYREAGGPLRTSVFVRDMDSSGLAVAGSRGLEVVVDGLPLRGGAHFAVDTTLVCADESIPSRCSSSHRCTIRDCGTVCANSWKSHQTCAMMLRGVRPVCLWSSEDWV